MAASGLAPGQGVSLMGRGVSRSRPPLGLICPHTLLQSCRTLGTRLPVRGRAGWHLPAGRGAVGLSVPRGAAWTCPSGALGGRAVPGSQALGAGRASLSSPPRWHVFPLPLEKPC